MRRTLSLPLCVLWQIHKGKKEIIVNPIGRVNKLPRYLGICSLSQRETKTDFLHFSRMSFSSPPL